MSYAFIEPFTIGVLLHAGLLFNAINQNAFILSRGLSGASTIPIVIAFILSSILSATLGIYAFDMIDKIGHDFGKIIGISGASILAYQAYKAYKYARNYHHYNAKAGDMISALALVWLTPHLYVDIIAISSVAVSRSSSDYIPLILGFSTMATIWFSTLALFTKKISNMYNNKLHTALHYASAIILLILSIAVIGETFFDMGHHH